MKDSIKAFLKDNFILCIVAALYGIYMIIMMFANAPWYDELYTYYYFVSRGPVYSAIHWPVPNNHIGYSVLSGCLIFIKNPFIRLRGISVAASVVNLILVYVFSHKFFKREIAVIISVLYAGAGMVVSLGIQGRGYILATSCMMFSVISMYHICLGEKYKRYILGFILGLTYGLYILPSSVYWVLPICFTGGLYLLIKKEWKLLGRLIAYALVAAVLTFGLYSLVWLAIGANLMSDDPSKSCYGVYQMSIILKAPFASLKTGMDYMLATPYIQSIERSEVITGLFGYLSRVYDQFYGNMGNVIVVFEIVMSVLGVIVLLGQLRKKAVSFEMIFIVALLALVPLILVIQSVQPYLRVLSFMMMPIAFSFGMVINKIIEWCCGLFANNSTKMTSGDGDDMPGENEVNASRGANDGNASRGANDGNVSRGANDGNVSRGANDGNASRGANDGNVSHDVNGVVLTCAMVVFSVMMVLLLLVSSSYREPLAGRENDIRACLDKTDAKQISSIYYTDDFQKYVMKFYYDISPAEVTLEEAEYVMVSSEMKDREYNAYIWPMLVCYDENMLSYIDGNFDPVGESNGYTLLKRR